MAADRVRIGELRLSVEGLSRDEAARLAAEVAARVAAAIPAVARPIGALQLRVTAEAGVAADRLAERISSAVVRGLS
jgi:hypothetical protein